MPGISNGSFLYLRKRNHFSFYKKTTSLVWSVEESDTIHDLSFFLLNQTKDITQFSPSYRDKMTKILSRPENSEKINPPFEKNKKFEICLETFAELDEADIWTDYSFTLNTINNILSCISDLLNQGYTIGINFRELFLVEQGENPPSQYRPNIDICLTDFEEYKNKKKLFSYQLGKAILSRYKPTSTEIENTTIQPIIPIVIPPNITWNFETPLKDYYYSNSPEELLILLHKPTEENHSQDPIISFKHPVSIKDVELIFKFYKRHPIHELTLVFKGETYKNKLERQKIYEETLKLLEQEKYPFLIQIILITKDNMDASLLDLKPITYDEQELFQPLAQDAGYYLSSPQILSLNYRAIQSENTTFNDEFCLKKLDLADEQPRIELAPKAYIYAQKASQEMRASKTLTQGQLKSQACLAITHQEALTQTHAITEQVQETHNQNSDLNLSLNQNLNYSEGLSMISDLSWNLKTNFDDFCKKLEIFAQNKLPEVRAKQNLLKQAGCLTQFYLKNSKCHFFEQLANNKDFRFQVAATLFGYALIKSENESDANSFYKVVMPHHSIDNIENDLTDYLINNIDAFSDGISLTSYCVRENFIFGRTLVNLHGLNNHHKLPPAAPTVFSYLSCLSQLQTEDIESRGFQSLHYLILLTEEELAGVEPEQQQILIDLTKNLLALFQPHSPLSAEAIHIQEEQLISLIRFYFPNRAADIQRLEQFIAGFDEHNEDNLKIILQLIIGQHKKGLVLFFKLLTFLEERSLLDFLYKIYFKYATSISTIEHLLKFSNHDIFLKLTGQIPIGKPRENWPPFESFALHFLFFAAQNNFSVNYNELASLKNLWNRLYAKFLSYCGNQDTEAQQLLNKLTQQLINENGLSIAPLARIETFVAGLEHLIDHAISKHVLKEQIDEIAGISFLSTDAAYAYTWNNFQVLCSEMQIHSVAINPKTKSYAISNTELMQAMIQHKPGDKALKTALFRYLGAQQLREDLQFYRELQQATTQTEETTTNYIAELLCAYYALTLTGQNYRRPIDEKEFSNSFISFLAKHHLAKTLSSVLLTACIDHFFAHLHQIPTDEQHGVQSLWTIWQTLHVSAFITAKAPIPEIFLRKFAAKQTEYFLSTQRENLEKALPALNDQPQIVEAILYHWCDELNIAKDHQKFVSEYLKLLLPLDMKTLLQNTTKIAHVLTLIASLSHSTPNSLLYLALEKFIEGNRNIDAFIALLQHLSFEMAKHQGLILTDRMAIRFLLFLAKKPLLSKALPQAIGLVNALLESFLNNELHENLEYLLNCIETLLPLGLDETQQLFPTLLQIAGSDEGTRFLAAHPQLSAAQLRELVQFVQKVHPLSLALTITNWLYDKNNAADLAKLTSFLAPKSADEIECLLVIAQAICQSTERCLLTELQQLHNKPLADLKKLAQLHKLTLLTAKEILVLLAAPSLSHAISSFQRQKYQENLQRYHYEPQIVREKIAQIKLKSPLNDEAPSLKTQEQDLLWQDYQLVMSYLTEKPVKFEIQGTTKESTLNALDENEFKILLQTLRVRINAGEDIHHNQLLFIAASAEALYRTTHKFPRCTQILALLTRLHYPSNLIHEIKTGEGKSIVAAMYGALFWGLGYTVDIITENNQLAKNALEKFAPFYQYLGIPHGENILTAQSAHQEYVANGVNYSTASNLALFRTRMALEEKELPEKPALVSDEIDSTLTATVQFRLAANLEPLSNNVQAWSSIYQLVLAFVKEKDIFLNNPCHQKEDIYNLRNYFIIKNSDQTFQTITNKISDELLGVLIESAVVAHSLEENVDYYVVETKHSTSNYYYAAPIIASTKRPDPNVSYSEHIQQLLHTLLNNQKPSPIHPFLSEPSTEMLVATSAKNFFDYYKLHNGPIAGLTGTAGSRVERGEFYDQQGLLVLNYPTFYPDRAQDLGLITAFGTEDHLKKIFEFIKNHKQQNPAQPILLVTRSPQATEQLSDYLATRTTWKLQCYHGYEKTNQSEDRIIDLAGKNDSVTIANQSLARGADITPEHQDGLLVINLCTDLTFSELQQIYGRAGRNGQKAQYLSLINAETIGTSSDSPETLAEAFKTHQYNISLQQQQERSKKGLLDEARHLMISEYVLKFREAVDKILRQQLGEESSIIEHNKLLPTLNWLNQRAEKHYLTLLAKHPEMDEISINEFLTARCQDHQSMLEQWMPAGKFDPIQFVEPPIPLENLTALDEQLSQTTTAQLKIFAGVFHRKWQLDGHKKTKQQVDKLDELVELFAPYFKGQCSFKQAIGHILEKEKLVEPEYIDSLGKGIQTNLDEMLNYAESIAIVGRFVPKEKLKQFFADYLNTTKAQINQKQWDHIAPPALDLSAITNWFNKIGSTLSLLSFGVSLAGGPVIFLIKQFLLPAVFKWIKNKLKQQFANAESQVAQILIGIDEIANDVSEAISALLALTKEANIKIGVLVDKLRPLIKNKVFLLALSKYLELIERPDYLPLVQALPDFIEILATYRDRRPAELLKVDTLVAFLQQMAHSKSFLEALKNSPYQEHLVQLSQLDATFITQISALSFPEFLSLLKVIAHPNFYTLLTKLPANTTYTQLCQWIFATHDNLPSESQLAMQEMLDYQSNHERIVAEKQQTLLDLRSTYSLTLEKFKAGLDKLKPQAFIPPALEKADEVEETEAREVLEIEKNEPVEEHEIIEEISTLETQAAPIAIANIQTAQCPSLGLKEVITFTALTLSLAYSILYLSVAITLISLILIGWAAFPYAQYHLSTWRTPTSVPLTEEQTLESSPLHLLKQNPVVQQLPGSTPSIAQSETVQVPIKKFALLPEPTNLSGSKYLFWGKQPASTPALLQSMIQNPII